jgi:hypothetical protein
MPRAASQSVSARQTSRDRQTSQDRKTREGLRRDEFRGGAGRLPVAATGARIIVYVCKTMTSSAFV